MAATEEIDAKVLATLSAQTARRRQASAVLRSEIRAVISAHSVSGRLTAKHIAKLLEYRPLPSIRTTQDHMKEIKAASPVPRF
jgi:hypothetical protein